MDFLKCIRFQRSFFTWFTVSSLRTFQKSDFFMLTSGWRGVWVWGCPILFKQFVVKKTHTQVFAQNKLEKVQTLIDLINPDKTQNIWLFIDPGLTLPWMKRLKRTHKRRRGVRWGLEERAILPQNIISKHRNVDMRLETKSCINWYLFIATKICAVLAKWQEGFPRRFEGSQTADRPSNGTLTPTWSIFPCPLEPVWEPQNFPPPKKTWRSPMAFVSRHYHHIIRICENPSQRWTPGKQWLAACTLATVPVGVTSVAGFFRAFGVHLDAPRGPLESSTNTWNQRFTRCFYVFKYSLHKSTVTSRLHQMLSKLDTAQFLTSRFGLESKNLSEKNNKNDCSVRKRCKLQLSWTNFQSSQGDSF